MNRLGCANACEVSDFQKHRFLYVHCGTSYRNGFRKPPFQKCFIFALTWRRSDHIGCPQKKKTGVHVGTASRIYWGNLTRFLWEIFVFVSKDEHRSRGARVFFQPTSSPGPHSLSLGQGLGNRLFSTTTVNSNFEREPFPQLLRYNSDFFSLSKAKVAFARGLMANFCSRFNWLQLEPSKFKQEY